jgi:chaperonin GroES
MKKSKTKGKKSPKAKVKAAKTTSTNKLGVTPAGDRVLVRRTPPEETTSFGIIIPDTNKEKTEEGVVVAVGPGKKNNDGKLIPVSFSVGQRVRFSYGDDIKIKGVEHVLVHEDSITAIIG